MRARAYKALPPEARAWSQVRDGRARDEPARTAARRNSRARPRWKDMLKNIKQCAAVAAPLLWLGLAPSPAQASITLRGTVPASRTPTVILPATGATALHGVVKFLFTAPTAGAYALSFCIGPAANPCGFAPPTSTVVNVPGGDQKLLLIDASLLTSNVLVVGQGTTTPLPYTVTIE